MAVSCIMSRITIVVAQWVRVGVRLLNVLGNFCLALLPAASKDNNVDNGRPFGDGKAV